ncbi:hypothetical protein BLNAU_20898 [Blattamonas nauphoetae]|uniref:Uncharacterized protein n=1 Tax=Blattamonas nauphoetae TaxID=2049346 RepID=A0ABQ9X1K8_9EUKA|nr:hypothetical protein BLNAU_20894 [Blattamonas nauphoetae]KAK2944189.1 hypothetical protein BLNAU_20898 [Blattamonas nauphoetae]
MQHEQTDHFSVDFSPTTKINQKTSVVAPTIEQESEPKSPNQLLSLLQMFSGPHSESQNLVDSMIELDCVQHLAVFCDLSKPEACPEEFPKLLLLLRIFLQSVKLFHHLDS